MRLGAPKEIYESEARVAMTPDSAQALQKLGYECLIETGPANLPVSPMMLTGPPA